MNPATLDMLKRYECKDATEFENALIEIMQEIALLGLWRAKFFEHAAFYGGTALRILYRLDRFSQDLDFSLLQPNANFDLAPYLHAVEIELESMGFKTEVEKRTKNIETRIESAFIKAGTKEHLLKIQVPDKMATRIHKKQLMNVKFEVDTDPPGGFNTDVVPVLTPVPFFVKTYTRSDLFAGKLHAILQRKWAGRVKGRDFYDFVWYIGREIPVHLYHLEQRLRQSGGWTETRPMTQSDLNTMLENKFRELDLDAAKADVRKFLRDPASLEIWSQEFFISLLPRLKIADTT
jgi:hypothetical protein